MSSSEDQGIKQLVALGFTELEASVYVFLLRESPATGYRVAQGIGRTAANTYRALEALEARGAVMVEEGETRLCRAVAPEELLRGIESTFLAHRRQASTALSGVYAESADDRVYQLRTTAQVFERCRGVLAKAQHVALLDAFPGPLAELRADMEAAAARGVRVAVQAYEPIVLPGVEVVVSYQAEPVRARWSGQWINLVADALTQVQALLTSDCAGVRHAAWSGSPFLAFLYHSGLLGEISTSALRRGLMEGASAEALNAIMCRMDDFKHAVQTGFDPPESAT